MISDNAVYLSQQTQTNFDGVLSGDGHFVNAIPTDETGGLATVDYVQNAIKLLGNVIKFTGYSTASTTTITTDVPDRERDSALKGFAVVIDYVGNKIGMYYLAISQGYETRSYTMIDAGTIGATFSYNATTKKITMTVPTATAYLEVNYYISRD